MKIAVDVNEVIVSLVELYLIFFNREYNGNVKFEDLVSYNLRETLHISKEAEKELFEIIYSSPEFDNLPLIDGAYDGLIQLAKDNEVILATHRPITIQFKTKEYFKKTFPNIPFDIVHSYNGRKSEICRDFGVELIIEDHPGCAFDCAKLGIRAVLFDKPWNQTYEGHNLLRKVSGWNEFMLMGLEF